MILTQPALFPEILWLDCRDSVPSGSKLGLWNRPPSKNLKIRTGMQNIGGVPCCAWQATSTLSQTHKHPMYVPWKKIRKITDIFKSKFKNVSQLTFSVLMTLQHLNMWINLTVRINKKCWLQFWVYPKM